MVCALRGIQQVRKKVVCALRDVPLKRERAIQEPALRNSLVAYKKCITSHDFALLLSKNHVKINTCKNMVCALRGIQQVQKQGRMRPARHIEA